MGKRIILIKSAALDVVKYTLGRGGHEVVATATDQIEAVEVLGDKSIEADVIVTGRLLYRSIGGFESTHSYELAEDFRQRGLPVVVHSTKEAQRSDWPEDMPITIVEDAWDRESLLAAVDSAGKPQT